MTLPHFVTGFAAVATVVCLGVLFVTLRAIRRLRAVPHGAWVVVELAGALGELAPPLSRWRRFLPRPPVTSVASLRRLAKHIARDARVTGVLVRLGELSCGWATAESLRDVLAALRAAGKRVVVYMPHGGMSRELFVAAGAEKVYTSPQAGLAPIGVASGTTFYRALLERGGVEAEVLARREFKSATEPFTRDGYSDANRLQTGALLDAVHGALVAALVAGRGMTEAEARTVVDGGPYRPREALAARLLDGVAYDDELPTLLGAPASALVKAPFYMALWEGWFARVVRRRRGGKRVGVVEVRGPIVVESRMALGRVADATRIIGALRAARASDGVAAVVLYINSPGGSALASDLIAREVARLREKKPVVAYFSDVAASGGYYVAAPANAIVAQPLTTTGSIGVFALRFVVQRALEKLGLSHEVIRRGARADIMSPYRHWTDDERAVLDREIDGFYEDFVAIVARGRSKTPEEIEPLARGRVYSGKDAHAVGLVDALGGLDTALARAAQLAGLAHPGEPVVVHPPRELPDPPEPPAPLQPFVSRLGAGLDVVNLALNAERERLFAFEPDLP